MYQGEESELYVRILTEMERALQDGAGFTQDEVARRLNELGYRGDNIRMAMGRVDPYIAVALARGDSTVRFAYTGNADGISLSDRIWRDAANDFTRIFNIIKLDAFQGRSAWYSAKAIEKFITDGDNRGYTPWKSALRLIRSEMQAAFFAGQIEQYSEIYFIEGVKWNLSLSHRPSGCMCEQQARQDLYGLGRGVYPKDRVPGPPHPQCLCYLTSVIKKSAVEESL